MREETVAVETRVREETVAEETRVREETMAEETRVSEKKTISSLSIFVICLYLLVYVL